MCSQANTFEFPIIFVPPQGGVMEVFMKRIFAILLTVCICLSAAVVLASCGDPNAGGEIKTTVTEAEWKEAMARNNFTLNGFLTERDVQESLTMKFTEKLIYTKNEGVERFVGKNGDSWCMTVDGMQFGSPVNGVSASVDFALRTFRAPEYSSFTYDEETKSYVYVNSETSGFYQINVYFENGYVVKVDGCEDKGDVTHSFNFTDYGKTTVELPAANK